MPRVNPDILTWARETAGLSLENAAREIKLHAAGGLTGGQRLQAFEDGQDEPSRVLLHRMAQRYRRPLIVFYLKERPLRGERGEDFRRAPDAPPPDYDPRLDALIRDVRARHDLAASLLEDEEARPLPFIGSHNMREGADAIARNIQSTIDFDLAEFRRPSKVEGAFAYLRGRLESRGIFVLLLGNLGSFHTNISSTTFRGYSIADPLAPFIVINDNDARAAWSFTALHEAAHLWLGQTGISGAGHQTRVERFCNDVAGQLLLPREEVAALSDLARRPFDEVLAEISTFAAERNISRRMVAYQLVRAEFINNSVYERLCDRFRQDWLRSKEKDADKPRENNAVSYYTVKRHRIGPALLGLAQRAIDAGTLTPTRAAKLLGVRPISVRPLLHPAAG